jgi:hypothetical protein
MGMATRRHPPLIKEGVHSAYLVLGLLVGALLDQKLGISEVAVEHGDEERRSASLKIRDRGASTTRNMKMGQNAQPGPEEGRGGETLQKWMHKCRRILVCR